MLQKKRVIVKPSRYINVFGTHLELIEVQLKYKEKKLTNEYQIKNFYLLKWDFRFIWHLIDVTSN